MFLWEKANFTVMNCESGSTAQCPELAECIAEIFSLCGNQTARAADCLCEVHPGWWASR